MTNNDVRKILENAGIRCLTDDEVIDRGSYVIVKDYDPSANYLIDNDAYYRHAVSGGFVGESPYDAHSRRHNKCTTYIGKPLRIEAVIAEVYDVTGGSIAPLSMSTRILFVGRTGSEAGRQMGGYIRSSGSYSRQVMSSTVRFRDYAVVPPSQLRPSHLRMLKLLAFLCDEDGPTPAYMKAGQMMRDMTRRHIHGGSAEDYAVLHGKNIPTREPWMWNGLTRVMAAAGEFIRLCANEDADGEDILNGMGDSLEYLWDNFGSVKAMAIMHKFNERSVHGAMERGVCGHFFPDDSGHSVYGGTVCESCFDDDYVYVEDTGDHRLRDDVYYHESEGEYYTFPEEGGDDDEYEGVRNYSTDVRTVLSRDKTIRPSAYGEFLMGIELEVVPTDESYKSRCSRDTAESLCYGYAIMKNDGSLDDGGFEIVTAPRGLAEHIRRFGEWVPHKELRSWDTDCCGMHVHISSQAFTQATLGKFIEFINSEANDKFIHEIAGRHPSTDSQCRQYCQREGRIVAANPKATVKGKSNERYRMVNTNNLDSDESQRLFGNTNHTRGRSQNTVELRVFKGTLNKARLLAQIEFAHAAVMFCRVASFRALGREDFLKWLKGTAPLYPNLAKWFGVRANKAKAEDTPKAREAAEV